MRDVTVPGGVHHFETIKACISKPAIHHPRRMDCRDPGKTGENQEFRRG
jgi:hypothetical protein